MNNPKKKDKILLRYSNLMLLYKIISNSKVKVSSLKPFILCELVLFLFWMQKEDKKKFYDIMRELYKQIHFKSEYFLFLNFLSWKKENINLRDPYFPLIFENEFEGFDNKKYNLPVGFVLDNEEQRESYISSLNASSDSIIVSNNVFEKPIWKQDIYILALLKMNKINDETKKLNKKKSQKDTTLKKILTNKFEENFGKNL